MAIRVEKILDGFVPVYLQIFPLIVPNALLYFVLKLESTKPVSDTTKPGIQNPHWVA
jgi:hypothetical protein